VRLPLCERHRRLPELGDDFGHAGEPFFPTQRMRLSRRPVGVPGCDDRSARRNETDEAHKQRDRRSRSGRASLGPSTV
jgi:hypothetical protein